MAPPVSLVVDHKDASPTSSDDPIENAFRLYLNKATEEERKVLQDEKIRGRVLAELERLRPVLPVLKRASEAAQEEAKRLGVETNTALEDRIASICRIVILEEEKAELINKLRLDTLTGAASGYAYREDVMGAMKKSIETGQSLWLYAVDVDGLKGVNDLYGHEIGNRVLQEITRRLQGAVRRNEMVYRPGGDEFLLLSSPDDEEGAAVIGDRLIKTVSSTPVCIETEAGILEIFTSISLGISQFNQIDMTGGKEDMEVSADRSMYRAKSSGKNCGFMYGRLIQEESSTSVRSTTVSLSSSIPPSGSRNHLSIVRGS